MTSQRRFRLIVFLLFVSVALPAYGQDAPLNGFDHYVNKALPKWEVSVAIVKKDQGHELMLVQGSGPSLVLLPKQQ
jgi:hypothetical protein